MKIALIVPGSFHAFALADALGRSGHDVHVLTTHPPSAETRRTYTIKGYPALGSFLRGSARLGLLRRAPVEAFVHQGFSSACAAYLGKHRWDVVHCWSGAAEEVLRVRLPGDPLRVLMRGSSHILTQDRLLAEEESRAGVRIDRPTRWMIRRELSEYALADRVRVLSRFAQQSFASHGMDPAKIWLLPSGLPAPREPYSPSVRHERAARIRSGAPVHVLFSGSLIYRKGLLDLQRVIEALSADPGLRFSIVGPATAESRRFVRAIGSRAQVRPALHGRQLDAAYDAADLFFFPTIEDGFPQAVALAVARGLPVLTTPNGNGPDLIEEGRNGWILPARSTEDFIARLRRCASDRSALAEMALYESGLLSQYAWAIRANEFIDACLSARGLDA